MKRAFLIFSLCLAPLSVFGAGASLYFSPASGSFFVGSTFDVSIFVNTGSENINAVEVLLGFDPKKLQIASPTTGKSFIEVWVSQPTFSNTKGTLAFRGGIPNPGVKTSAGLVSTVTFRVIAPGETVISFNDDCKVLRNDPYGTNILSSKSRGVYSLVVPPPEGPKVFSSTHPDQNKWYKDNNPTFSWEAEEGVTDFSYSFDKEPTGTPDSISDGNFTSVSYSDIDDGIWYFHVKAKKNGTWGGASHYPVQIDASSPASFTPTVEPSERTSENQPLVFFSTTDSLSGISHYGLKYIDITAGERGEEEEGFFQEVSSPYKLPKLNPGRYIVVVRAYDISGNWREETVNLVIYEKGIFFSWKGIGFNGYLISWWFIITSFIAFIILLLVLILIRQGKKERQRKAALKDYERRLSENKTLIQSQVGQSPNFYRKDEGNE